MAQPAHAADPPYSFTKIADDSTARPDRKGNFNLEYYWTPSLDGDTVVLLDAFNALTNPIDSIWAAPVGGGKFTRLVAAGAHAPGGTGAFAQLSAPIGATAKNGAVVFQSLDRSGPGVYTIPISGGTPKLVINYKKKFPDGAQFGFNFGLAEDTMSGVATDGAHVAINTGNGRLLVAALNGGFLTEAVDTANIGRYPLSPQVPLGVQLWSPNVCFWGNQYAPRDAGVAISGGDLVFTSGGSWDVEGNQGLYRTGLAGFGNGPYVNCWGTQINPPRLADMNTPLPGDPQAANPDDGFGAYVADAGEVAYVIGDAPRFSGGAGGYQCVMIQGADGKNAIAVACNQTLLPGTTTLPLQFYGVSLRDQTLAFTARDAANNVGLYAYQGGAVARIVASGDSLSGSPVQARWQEPDLTISPTATSGGAVAFNAITGAGIGAYVAQPAACATDVTGKLAIAQEAFKPHGAGQYVQVVTLTNTTAAPIAGTLALALGDLTGATLAGGGATSCAAPGGRPTAIVDLGPGQALRPRKSVDVTLIFDGAPPIAYRPSVLQGFRR